MAFKKVLEVLGVQESAWHPGFGATVGGKPIMQPMHVAEVAL